MTYTPQSNNSGVKISILLTLLDINPFPWSNTRYNIWLPKIKSSQSIDPFICQTSCL